MVGVIYARRQVLSAYSKHSLGDMSEWGGEIAVEVLCQCANLKEIE